MEESLSPTGAMNEQSVAKLNHSATRYITVWFVNERNSLSLRFTACWGLASVPGEETSMWMLAVLPNTANPAGLLLSALAHTRVRSFHRGPRCLSLPESRALDWRISWINWCIPLEQIQDQLRLICRPERECIYKYKLIFLIFFYNLEHHAGHMKGSLLLRSPTDWTLEAPEVRAHSEALCPLYGELETVQSPNPPSWTIRLTAGCTLFTHHMEYLMSACLLGCVYLHSWSGGDAERYKPPKQQQVYAEVTTSDITGLFEVIFFLFPGLIFKFELLSSGVLK